MEIPSTQFGYPPTKYNLTLALPSSCLAPSHPLASSTATALFRATAGGLNAEQ